MAEHREQTPWFNPNCTSCQDELVAAIHGEVPPANNTRHPESDRHETLRKGLTQCQRCFKSRGSGVTLSKCSGCNVELYCVCPSLTTSWTRYRFTTAFCRAKSVRRLLGLPTKKSAGSIAEFKVTTLIWQNAHCS